MCLPCWWVSRGSETSENRPGHGPERGPEHGDARWAARIPRAAPTGHVRPADDLGCYLIQASTLARLASTHFLAAASGVILSTAMYFATAFWSSFVQLNFFTRS